MDGSFIGFQRRAKRFAISGKPLPVHENEPPH
jgi:hypothetical protein